MTRSRRPYGKQSAPGKPLSLKSVSTQRGPDDGLPTNLFERLLDGFAHQGIRITADLLQRGNGSMCVRTDLAEGQRRLPPHSPLRISQGLAESRHGIARFGADVT